MKLVIKPEIARRLVWSAPDSCIAPFCSVCQAHIPVDAGPLKAWDSNGACIQFCDECSHTAFNVEPS